jgi:hypothetical protein
VDATEELDLRRALERRAESMALLTVLDGPALHHAEVSSALTEVHGLLKSAARTASVKPPGWWP